MESGRSFPPPTFPVSLNVFYHSDPHNWKESRAMSCEHQEQRDFISKQLLLKRRFPRLDVGMHLNSVSSPKNSSNFMKITQQSNLKTRSISPLKQPIIFKPCNHQEAKDVISRGVSSFDGNPYNDYHDISVKKYQESIQKRLSGEFKPAIKGKHLNDNRDFINSFNTFQTFSSCYQSEGEIKETHLFSL